MRKLLLTTLIGIAVGIGAAQAAEIVIRLRPPISIHERRTVRPSPRHVWIGGYHRYDGNAYVWTPGRWDVPPRSEEHTSELQSLRHPLFPYTTLFRSNAAPSDRARGTYGLEAITVMMATHTSGHQAAGTYRPDRKSTRLNSSHLGIHSFPTRRSSDLTPHRQTEPAARMDWRLSPL